MFTKLKEPFGKAGLIVACVALVAALGGSAIAANGGGSGDATASANKRGGNVGKLIKREARKFSKVFSLRFAKRFPGPMGPQGLPGRPGAPGSDGDDGSDGSAGSSGANGISVTVAGAPSVGECPAGGVKYTSASGDDAVCNGEDGESGFTATLPPLATQTGAWAFTASEASAAETTETASAVLSFSIPLADPLPPAGRVKFEGAAECPGSDTVPKADPGFVCVYESAAVNSVINSPALPGVALGTSGAIVNYKVLGDHATASGTFAVTAPEP